MDKLEQFYRNGGPWDRGMMDSYYRRSWNPHYYVGETHNSTRVEFEKLTKKEVQAYDAGFQQNEKDGDFKDW